MKTLKSNIQAFVLGAFSLIPISLSSAAAEPERISIGINLPLTGDVGEYGIAVKNGIEMARQENPKLFGNITFVFDDNRYEGQTAISVFQKQRGIDKVRLSFVWGDTPSLAVAPVAERVKSPILTVLTDPDVVRDFRYVIRFISSRHECTDVLLRYFRSQKISKLALMYAQSPYNTNYMLSLEESIGNDATLTVLGNFLPDAMDFRSAIVKAKGEKFDALGLYLLPSQVRAFLKQAKTLHLAVPLFGMDVFQSNQTIEQSDGTLEGAVFPTNMVDGKFEKQYRAMFKDDSHLIYAANGYEFAQTVGAIADILVQQSEGTAVLDALKKLPLRKGALGDYIFRHTQREGQHFEFPVVLKRIKGTKVEVVGWP